MDDTRRAADEAQHIAERVRDAMIEKDKALQELGIEVVAIGPGHSRLTMRVQDRMLNAFGICHGAFITAIADSAFAYACNACNEQTVAAGITLDFLRPGQPGELLTAEAKEELASGRTGVYDVRVTNPAGELVALMRGRSYRMKGRALVPTD